MTIKENFSLQSYNTFNINAKADYFIEIDTPEDLKNFSSSGLSQIKKRLILGGGSNILFTKDFDGVILHSEITTTEVVEENNGEVFVRVGSGVNWDDFVAYCVKRNWGGIENLSDIPGNTGAAPVQNIGAYGVEAKDCIVYVETFDLNTTEQRKIKNVECKFDYRYSIFKEPEAKDLFITYVTFRLSKSPTLKTTYGKIKEELNKYKEKNIASLREAIINIRCSKLPSTDELGSAGSFFKNPVIGLQKLNAIQSDYPEIPFYELNNKKYKIPAAWLIETSGLKGYKTNNVGTYPKQPLVIVNYGNANGSEVVKLARFIQAEVLRIFDIKLEPEVCFV